ncbi:MAG TPA: fatty acid desaturase [Gammaproteobacteria bacterium]|nr:fatty acid desaturase [Gammaproteobacteria bacterium]
MVFDGLVNLSVWGYVAVTLVMTHITIASVTIFLHRHQAHRALSLHPVASHFFRVWLWLTTGMVTREWVAVHRKHHAKCETEADPHSPQVLGIWRVLFGGVGLYRTEANKQETLEAYGRGTPNDWLERHIYARYRYLGIGTMLVLDLVLFGTAGLLVYLVQMLWIPFWAAGVINGVGHYWGYRNFETQDASRNIIPFGVLIGGEEFHNNHHAYAYSAKLANKWWEFDIGWFYIRVLEVLGLASVKRTSPKTSFASGKETVDIDTLRAVIGNRFHVLKLYGRRVIAPVVRGHADGENDFPHRHLVRIRRLMTREDEQLGADPTARQWLEAALQGNQTLRTVYDFKQRLKALWGQQSGKTDSDRLKRLQAWCAEAEASGIRVLRDFAQQLQGYTAQAA